MLFRSAAVLHRVLPGPLDRIVVAPCVVGTRWVSAVAAAVAAVGVPPVVDLAGWLLLAVGIVLAAWRMRSARTRVPS